MGKIEELREKAAKLTDEAQGLQDAADAAGRELTAEEGEAVASYLAEAEGIHAEIARRERLQAAAEAKAVPLPRKVPAEPVVGSTPRIEIDEGPKGRWGWRNMGEFARAVKDSVRGARMDARLQNAPTTYSSEGVGADGGFAVPPEFRAAIWQKVSAEESLLSRTDQLTSSGNSITVPKDETTPWQTSGGVLAYWEGENSQLTQSKVALEQSTIRLHKLAALVPVTEELLEDAPALTAYLGRKVPEKINHKVDLAIVRGTGAGQPLGVMNSPALVTVAKETSQAADTILFENVAKMWSRCYAPSRRNAVWLINQDAEPALMAMTVNIKNVAGTENVGGSAVYIPAGGLAALPYGTLFGRPVIPHQTCETVGDLGDIVLVDFTQYMTAVKSGGIRAETSMHLWFDYDTTAFRFIFRIAGQPWWSSTVAQRDGSNTLSPYVTLAERA